MKQIINGKLYNTETASYIGSNRSDCYRSDFHYFEEELYRKKQRNFSYMEKEARHPCMRSN